MKCSICGKEITCENDITLHRQGAFNNYSIFSENCGVGKQQHHLCSKCHSTFSELMDYWKDHNDIVLIDKKTLKSIELK